MSGDVFRTDETLQVANLAGRTRILEAIGPESATGGLIQCIGCYEIPPEFADCIDLAPGTFEDLSGNEGSSNPSVADVPGSELLVGNYQCNYFAGFRVEVQLHISITAGNSTQTRFWAGLAIDPGAPSTWTQLTNFSDTGYEATLVKRLEIDPTGIGDPDDIWNVWLGVNNTSILFGSIWSARFSFRWVSASDPIAPPNPEAVGQMLVAVAGPDGPVWTTLAAPTAPGQVLTANGASFPTWV